MKTLVLILVVCVGLLLPAAAMALPYSDIVDFNYNGTGYQDVYDSFSYTHDLGGMSGTLNTGTLTIRQMYNQDQAGAEVWSVRSGDYRYIGTLSESLDGWETDSFVLSSQVLNEIKNDGWELTVKLSDNTSGSDRLRLDWSKLEGTYTPGSAPAPEPATMLLVGGGLFGLAGFRRKNKK